MLLKEWDTCAVAQYMLVSTISKNLGHEGPYSLNLRQVK